MTGISRRNIYGLLLMIFSLVLVISFINRSASVQDQFDIFNLTVPPTHCKHVSVAELDQWFHSKQWNEIPKIIHQTWKNKTLRPRQTQWSQTWCEQYKDWRYHLWTDDENDEFVRTKFPWFYPTFVQLTPAILRADSVRYLYMFHYGGLYLDLDYESIRRVDEYFVDKHAVFALLNYAFDSMSSVPNSWMASRPNHPVWTYVLYRTTLLWSHATDKERREFWNGKAEFFTGPKALFEGLMYYMHTSLHTDQPLNQILEKQRGLTPDAIFDIGNITFLGPKLMNAYDWMDDVGSDVCSAERATFDEKKCKEIVKPIYAITYWSHTYGHGHQNDANYLGNKGAT